MPILCLWPDGEVNMHSLWSKNKLLLQPLRNHQTVCWPMVCQTMQAPGQQLLSACAHYLKAGVVILHPTNVEGWGELGVQHHPERQGSPPLSTGNIMDRTEGKKMTQEEKGQRFRGLWAYGGRHPYTSVESFGRKGWMCPSGPPNSL